MIPEVKGTVASHRDPMTIENITIEVGVIGNMINTIAAIVLPAYIIDNKYFFVKYFPIAPAAIDPIILKRPIKAIDNAPKEATELQTTLIKLPWIIGLLDSAIKAGKWAVINASWKPQEKKPRKSIV